MPAVLEVILRPDRRRPDPAPVEVDMRRVFAVGIGLWAVALAVCAVLWRVGAAGTIPLWSCGAGLVLGLVGLLWERGRRTPH